MRMRAGLMMGALLLAMPAAAKDKTPRTFVVVNEAVGVPVFPNDITDRPYQVLGEVKAGVRKATIFSAEASQAKIYRELWERGEKMGADAVINAKYGDSKITLMSWGSTAATGTAIKFTAAPTPAVAPTPPMAPTPPAALVSPAAPTPAIEPAAPPAPPSPGSKF